MPGRSRGLFLAISLIYVLIHLNTMFASRSSCSSTARSVACRDGRLAMAVWPYSSRPSPQACTAAHQPAHHEHHARTAHRCAPNTPTYRTEQLLVGGDEVQQAASHALEPQPAAVAHVLGARGCVWQWRSRSMRGMHTHAKRRRTCGSRCRPGPARRQAAVEQPCWQPPWPRCSNEPS